MSVEFRAYANSTVKWDMETFVRSIQVEMRAIHPSKEVSKQDWALAADTIYTIFSENPNVLVLPDSVEFYSNEAQKKIVQVFSGLRLDCILKKTEALFLDTLKKIQGPQMGDNEGFIEFYRQFITKIAGDQSPLLKTWGSNEFDIRDINRELSLAQIKRRYGQFGVIQLREINPKATTLIFGCGNGRISDFGNHRVEWEEIEMSEYSVEHNHGLECVTIDPALDANPTICAFGGKQLLAPIFCGQKFNKIIFEDFSFNYQESPYKEDLEQLMANGCQIITPEDLYKLYIQTDKGKRELMEVESDTSSSS